MYIYLNSEPGLWTVGSYGPEGKWISESDHDSADDAARRVNYLNGATPELFQAAQALVNWYETNAPNVKGGPHDAYELALAAIAKSEGKS